MIKKIVDCTPVQSLGCKKDGRQLHWTKKTYRGDVLHRACLKRRFSSEIWIVIQRKITITETA